MKIPRTAKKIAEIIYENLIYTRKGKLLIGRGRLLREGLDPEDIRSAFMLFTKKGIIKDYKTPQSVPGFLFLDFYPDEEGRAHAEGEVEYEFYHEFYPDKEKLFDFLKKEVLLQDEKIDFLEEKSALVTGNEVIEILPESKQFYFCKTIFSYPVNNKISIDSAYEETTGDFIEDEGRAKEMLRGLCRVISDKIKKKWGIDKFVVFKKSNVIRRY